MTAIIVGTQIAFIEITKDKRWCIRAKWIL